MQSVLLLADTPAPPDYVGYGIVGGIGILITILFQQGGPLLKELLAQRQKNRVEDGDRTLAAAWKMLDRQKEEIEALKREYGVLQAKYDDLMRSHVRCQIEHTEATARIDHLEEILRANGIAIPSRRGTDTFHPLDPSPPTGPLPATTRPNEGVR